MFNRFHKDLRSLGSMQNIDVSHLSNIWSDVYRHAVKHHGKAYAVKFVKELNTICERYALRQRIESKYWIKSDKDNFPNLLGKPFKAFLRSSDPRKVVLALSVMRSCEDLTLPISKDIDTVISPSKADGNVIEEINNFIPKWISRIKPVNLSKVKYHLTVKNGPNGHALWTSDSDILAVTRDPKLYESIRIVEDKQGVSYKMNEAVVDYGDNPIHSKLSQISDKAGKTRTIAIIDYYSQRCLLPLHKSIMSILASLVSDGTYSHMNVGRYAQQVTLEKGYIYCADLTAFTDRFPASIQRAMLFEMIKDSDHAQALWTLLAERTFKLAWSDELVTYQCGQPMGCYASWPLCTLAHHLLVEFAAYKVGVSNIKTKYRLIGDDVIITDERTALSYQKLITALGVEINYGKTVVTPETADYSAAEVAKQLYLNGKCLTPMTPGFVRNLKKPYMFNTCVGVLMDRYEFFGAETPSMLINCLFRKEKVRKLVWVLASNPLTGVIKPGFPGYDDNCPWRSRILDEVIRDYRKIVVGKLQKQVEQFLVDCFFNQRPSTAQGSPWKDSTRNPPKCFPGLISKIKEELINTSYKIDEYESTLDINELAEVDLSFIPNPMLPYMERKELRQKIMSSVIEELYKYTPPPQRDLLAMLEAQRRTMQ